MTAPTHSHPNYEYETAQSGDTEITYHRVTDETAGRVQVPGGTQDVRTGDVIVPTERGDVFHVLPSNALDELGKGSQSDSGGVSSGPTAGAPARNRSRKAVDQSVVESDDFGDPSDHTAGEVNRRVVFLRNAGRDDEANALVEAEQNGKNRKSAIPA